MKQAEHRRVVQGVRHSPPPFAGASMKRVEESRREAGYMPENDLHIVQTLIRCNAGRTIYAYRASVA